MRAGFRGLHILSAKKTHLLSLQIQSPSLCTVGNFAGFVPVAEYDSDSAIFDQGASIRNASRT